MVKRKPRYGLLPIIILLTSAISFGVAEWMSWLISLILIVIAVLITRRYSKRRHYDLLEGPQDTADGRFPVHQLEDGQLFELQRLAGQRNIVQPLQAKLFALAISAPAELRQRVVEEYTPTRRTIEQQVSISVQVPRRYLTEQNASRQLERILFPILVPSKGEVQDNLSIFSADGSQLSAFSYRESLQLNAAILRLLLLGAYNISPSGGLNEDARRAELLGLLAMMRRRDPKNPQLLEDESAENAILGLKAPNDASLKLAAAFVRKLRARYVIVVPVAIDQDQRFFIRYTRSLIPELRLSNERNTRMSRHLGRLQVALGARPVDVTIAVENAPTCQSYHLIVTGSDDLYITRQNPLDFEGVLTRQARGAPTKPHCRFQRRLGQPYAHFYARYFSEPEKDETPRVRFQYAEVPPGSMLRALITGIASLFLIWLVGFVISKSCNSVGATCDPGTDAPAFLLAFPAIVATWLGFDAPTRRLLEGTLAARISLILTAMLSIGAAGLFMLYKVFKEEFSVSLPYGVAVLGVTEAYWAAIVLLALANVVIIAYKYKIRNRSFTSLSGRPVFGGGPVQSG